MHRLNVAGLRALLIMLTGFALTACVEDSSPSQDDDADAQVDMAAPDVEVPDVEVPDAEIPDAEIPDAEMMGMVCLTNEDCPPGSECGEDGLCTPPECEQDDQCNAPLQLCREGACLDRCLGPGTCLRGGVCIDGACEPPQCEEDEDCGDEALVCRGGLCIDAKPCETDDQCERAERCEANNCEPRPVCGGDANCADEEICQDGLCFEVEGCDVRDDCDNGLDCVEGRCVPFICRGDVDCENGEVCNAGSCEAPLEVEVAEIIILNRPRAVVPGQQVAFRAIGLDERGDIVQVRGFTWSSDAPDAVAIDADTGLATAGLMLGEAAITAALPQDLGDPLTSDPVSLRVVAPAPAEGVRIRVTDASTGAAVPDAAVLSGEVNVVTDAEGVAILEGVAPPLTVTVFGPEHDHVTLVGIDRADLHITLTPRSDDRRVAGFTGAIDLSRVENEGDVELGLAGSSFGEGVSSLDFATLLGELFTVEVDAGITSFDLPLPGGLTFSAQVPFLGELEIKDTWYATSKPGFRLAWSFAGRVDLGQVIGLVQGGGGFDAGQVLATVLPFFELFNHGLRVADGLEALPRVVDEDDLDGDGDEEERIPDYDRFPVLNSRPDQNQALRLSVNVPPLPEAEGTTVALLFAGVDMPEVGFVPLGLSSATEAGVVRTRMAAPYAGLEAGTPTGVAISAEFGDGAVLPREISMQIQRYADRIPNLMNFAGPFLALPDGVNWDGPMRRVEGGGVEGVSAHRVQFRGGAGRWTIWFAPGAPVALNLPFPPMGLPDLAAGTEVRLEAIRLQEGVGLADLVGEGGPGDLADVDRFVTGVSRAVQ